MTTPNLLRRQLLTVLALSPLSASLPLWAQAIHHYDLTRVVVLEWRPIELLLALGVTPLGVAEVKGYREWVVEPAIPASSIDVGLRTEPNLELITQLKPSLILVSSGYGPAESQLRSIAPTFSFAFNDGSDGPLNCARRSIQVAAQLLGREAQAKQHLAELDSLLAETRARLAARSHKPLLLMSLMDDRHSLVFGKGSLFLDVMDAVGIANAWQGETNFWGSTVVGIERLAEMKDVDVLCFAHGDDEDMARLQQTALWQSMPFMRNGRFRRIPGIWFYGATLSVMRFCRLLQQSLGESA